jgi:hypothetical protein
MKDAMHNTDVTPVDSHFHADILHHVCPRDFAAYAKAGAGISWSYVHEPQGWERFPRYFDSLETLCRHAGLGDCTLYYLVGVHPRSLPPTSDGRMNDAFWSSLEAHVTRASCLGLGELGLETGSQEEVAVLRQQLRWACSKLPPDKRIGIHTPRRNKAEMTRLILDMVAEMPLLHERMVIDHVNEENLSMVMETGLMMGMTMQQGKMTPEKLADLLERYPQLENRVMLNSDSALQTDPLYWKTVKHGLPGISRRVHTKLIRDNACSFWGICVGRPWNSGPKSTRQYPTISIRPKG